MSINSFYNWSTNRTKYHRLAQIAKAKRLMHEHGKEQENKQNTNTPKND